MNNFNNQENSSQHVNPNKKPEQTPAQSQTSTLQDASNTEEIDKNPENALQEEASEREQAIESNDGSSGNQTIRDAVEHLNQNELAHNLKDDEEQEKSDKPSENPAPFISPD